MARLGEGRPSVTALGVAQRRAAHQILDAPPVFADPLAVAILGGDAYRAHLDENPGRERSVFGRAIRAYMAARSRYAEDMLAEAHGRGVRQYVVLGAGLDTFAYRNPWPGLKVFEVDHPSTQVWKRIVLEKAGIAAPEGMTFAPVDFQTQALAEGLAAAGFDARAPAFFSWLGVIMYLTDEEAFRTLAYVASLPEGSEIVFDFPIPRADMSLIAGFAYGRLAKRVAAAGEPFRSAYDPADLVRRLHAIGFSQAETLGIKALNERYFTGRKDGLKLRGAGRMARARV